MDKEALHVLLGITPEGLLLYAIYYTESADNYREILQDIKSHGVGKCQDSSQLKIKNFVVTKW